MKSRYLLLLALLVTWGCNQQEAGNPANEEPGSEQSATDKPKQETAADSTEDSQAPEIVAPSKKEVKVTHVITSEEVYYLDGPQQMRPPDGKFPAGTKVELVQEAGSYSMVVSEDGISAYVSTGALKPIE